jgi:hypothetical protein
MVKLDMMRNDSRTRLRPGEPARDPCMNPIELSNNKIHNHASHDPLRLTQVPLQYT